MNHHIVRPALAAVLILPAIVAAQPAEPADPPPRMTTIAIAISQIRKEATEAWARGKQWPRGASDFAIEKNWVVPNRDLVRVLGTRLGDSPAMDAYIKWQLLSFKPDLSAANVQSLNRITATMPDPIKQPEPVINYTPQGQGVSFNFMGRVTPYVQDIDPVVGDGVVVNKPRIGVVGSGVSLGGGAPPGSGPTIYEAVDSANRQLESARRSLEAANYAIHRYRDDLIPFMPTERGVRLATMIKDVRDRLVAADETCHDALRRVLSEGDGLADDLPDDVRSTLWTWTTILSQTQSRVIERVYVGDGEKIMLEARGIALSPEDLRRLMNELRQNWNPPARP